MQVDLADIAERGPLDPSTLWRLTREVASFRPQILHAHDPKTNLFSLILGRWFRIPVLTTLHGYVTRGGRLETYYAIDRWSLRRMDHVVAVSEDLYELAASLGIPPSRCSLIRNGIDTEQFCRQRSAAEAKFKLGWDPHRFVIGAVGRLSPEKGFDLLIRAVHHLAKTGVQADLVIIGEGEQRAELQALIYKLDCAKNVKLLGYRSETQGLYEAMDLFALSSLREGLPNVLLEAMAMEVPVVATRIAGVPRLVRDKETGLLVEPGDEDGLAGAIACLAKDPDSRSRLGKAGRMAVESGFSFAIRMQKIRLLYDHLVKC
jgi:glycosyltransferase involved in cell wall biosynthesis